MNLDLDLILNPKVISALAMVASAWLYRDSLVRLGVKSVSYGIDLWVDFKWKYMMDAQPNNEQVQTEHKLTVIQETDDYVKYKYHSRTYISFSGVPTENFSNTSDEEVDLVIDHLIVFSEGEKTIVTEPGLVNLIRQCLGHNVDCPQVLSLSQLRMLPEFSMYEQGHKLDKIIVNTDDYLEYVID